MWHEHLFLYPGSRLTPGQAPSAISLLKRAPLLPDWLA